MRRMTVFLPLLLGVLPALAAPVPKAIKRDPLCGEWVIVSGQPSLAGTYHVLHITPGRLWYEGWPKDSTAVTWEVEEDDDGDRFLVLLDCGHGRRRHPFTLTGGVLTVGDRVDASSVSLRRER